MNDLKDESRLIESEENSMVPSLERRIIELETMLEAAEEDAEAQKKLAEELGNVLNIKLQLFCENLFFGFSQCIIRISPGGQQIQIKSTISFLCLYAALNKAVFL